MSDLAAALEPYVLLAKPANGLAAMKIVEQATSAPGVYVFSELLELPNIQALKQDPSSVKAVNLLELFAYGTLQEYTSSPQSYTSLSPAHTTKLRHLTLVSLASQRRILPYADILQALQLDSENELEDLIIDVIYAGLLRGRIHHYEKILHIDWVAGRDIRPEDLLVMQRSVQNWCTTAENLLRALDTQIAYTQETTAQQAHHTTLYNSHRDQIYTEVA
ncbi:hypothetical protein TREMEDRAFT_22874, partial [Tremella mesenterica DSM 1558]|uniref:uncharacterized protein n=1 Tax=Tremella mesenterica (strain ATCC 24925 / CBS 8224 / DSM 1558 / NBRC 9311 / NRRL Y-6157 / RJB 2259-6 / UBC 559-6) TaxID=578456 RepID=UPI0003F4A64E